MHAVYRLNPPRGSTQDARNSAGCGLDRIEHILRNDFYHYHLATAPTLLLHARLMHHYIYILYSLHPDVTCLLMID